MKYFFYVIILFILVGCTNFKDINLDNIQYENDIIKIVLNSVIGNSKKIDDYNFKVNNKVYIFNKSEDKKSLQSSNVIKDEDGVIEAENKVNILLEIDDISKKLSDIKSIKVIYEIEKYKKELSDRGEWGFSNIKIYLKNDDIKLLLLEKEIEAFAKEGLEFVNNNKNTTENIINGYSSNILEVSYDGMVVKKDNMLLIISIVSDAKSNLDINVEKIYKLPEKLVVE